MHRRWLGLIGLTLGLCGCVSPSREQIKPPPAKPDYVLPPADDVRFTNPPSFPEKTLVSGQPKKPDDNNGSPGMGGPGGARPAGARFGGPGGPGMGGGY
jgi:hypothetical protein